MDEEDKIFYIEVRTSGITAEHLTLRTTSDFISPFAIVDEILKFLKSICEDPNVYI